MGQRHTLAVFTRWWAWRHRARRDQRTQPTARPSRGALRPVLAASAQMGASPAVPAGRPKTVLVMLLLLLAAMVVVVLLLLLLLLL